MSPPFQKRDSGIPLEDSMLFIRSSKRRLLPDWVYSPLERKEPDTRGRTRSRKPAASLSKLCTSPSIQRSIWGLVHWASAYRPPYLPSPAPGTVSALAPAPFSIPLGVYLAPSGEYQQIHIPKCFVNVSVQGTILNSGDTAMKKTTSVFPRSLWGNTS